MELERNSSKEKQLKGMSVIEKNPLNENTRLKTTTLAIGLVLCLDKEGKILSHNLGRATCCRKVCSSRVGILV